MCVLSTPFTRDRLGSFLPISARKLGRAVRIRWRGTSAPFLILLFRVALAPLLYTLPMISLLASAQFSLLEELAVVSLRFLVGFSRFDLFCFFALCSFYWLSFSPSAWKFKSVQFVIVKRYGYGEPVFLMEIVTLPYSS